MVLCLMEFPKVLHWVSFHFLANINDLGVNLNGNTLCKSDSTVIFTLEALHRSPALLLLVSAEIEEFLRKM